MLHTYRSILAVAALFAATSAFSGEEEACTGCHAPGDLEGMSADAIVEEIRNGGFPPHKKFADLGDEDLKAIAIAMADY